MFQKTKSQANCRYMCVFILFIAHISDLEILGIKTDIKSITGNNKCQFVCRRFKCKLGCIELVLIVVSGEMNLIISFPVKKICVRLYFATCQNMFLGPLI